MDGYYVEFPVLDDGKVLTLARGIHGARLKRWKLDHLIADLRLAAKKLDSYQSNIVITPANNSPASASLCS